MPTAPTGPFYFAWVDYASGAVPTFGPEHEVEDEEIVSFTVEQKEGDFATLNIDVRNPKIGLLAPGRPIWACLSYDGERLRVAWCHYSLVALSEFPPIF